MGLLSQIINKFIPTKPHNSAADGWENPFGTGAGQLVISPQESWQARLARQGAMRTAYTGKQAMTQGSTTNILQVKPAIGNQAFITHACISTDGPGFAYMGYALGNTVYYYNKYLPSAGSFEVKFDGVMMVRSEFDLSFKADNAGTNAVGSAIWLEVHE